MVARCSSSCVTARPRRTRAACCSGGPIRRSPSSGSAKRLRSRRASPSDARVIASPLTRTMETARAFGRPVEADERWIELDYGSFDGRSVAEVPADVWKAWRADPHYVPGGGESIATLGLRVREACEELLEEARSTRRDRREPRVPDQGGAGVGAVGGRRGHLAPVRAGGVGRARRHRAMGPDASTRSTRWSTSAERGHHLGREQPQVVEVVQVEHLEVDGARPPRRGTRRSGRSPRSAFPPMWTARAVATSRPMAAARRSTSASSAPQMMVLAMLAGSVAGSRPIASHAARDAGDESRGTARVERRRR